MPSARITLTVRARLAWEYHLFKFVIVWADRLIGLDESACDRLVEWLASEQLEYRVGNGRWRRVAERREVNARVAGPNELGKNDARR